MKENRINVKDIRKWNIRLQFSCKDKDFFVCVPSIKINNTK